MAKKKTAEKEEVKTEEVKEEKTTKTSKKKETAKEEVKPEEVKEEKASKASNTKTNAAGKPLNLAEREGYAKDPAGANANVSQPTAAVDTIKRDPATAGKSPDAANVNPKGPLNNKERQELFAKHNDTTVVREAYIPKNGAFIHQSLDSSNNPHYSVSISPKTSMDNPREANQYLSSTTKTDGKEHHFMTLNADNAKSGKNEGTSEFSRFAAPAGLSDTVNKIMDPKALEERFKDIEGKGSNGTYKTAPLPELAGESFYIKNPTHNIEASKNFKNPADNIVPNPGFDLEANDNKIAEARLQKATKSKENAPAASLNNVNVEAYVPERAALVNQITDTNGNAKYAISIAPRVTMNNALNRDAFVLNDPIPGTENQNGNSKKNHFIKLPIDKAKSGDFAGQSVAERFAESAGLKDEIAPYLDTDKLAEKFKDVEAIGPKGNIKNIPLTELEGKAFNIKNPEKNIFKGKFARLEDTISESPGFDAAKNKENVALLNLSRQAAGSPTVASSQKAPVKAQEQTNTIDISDDDLPF